MEIGIPETDNLENLPENRHFALGERSHDTPGVVGPRVYVRVETVQVPKVRPAGVRVRLGFRVRVRVRVSGLGSEQG